MKEITVKLLKIIKHTFWDTNNKISLHHAISIISMVAKMVEAVWE